MLRLARGSQGSILCSYSSEMNTNPRDAAAGLGPEESSEPTGSSPRMSFSLVCGIKTLTAAPASGRLVLQSSLSHQTYLFQLIAGGF